MTDGVASRIPIIVKPPTLMEDMMPCLYRVITTWTTEVFTREEAKVIFPYRGIVQVALGHKESK